MYKMMMVISSPTEVKNEIQKIRTLFTEGLNCFHLRKPDWGVSETQNFLDQIGLEYHSKIVLHQHFELTQIYKINQIHWNTVQRTVLQPLDYKHCTISTSTHHIKEFNTLDECFNYAFLSPIFPSISKIGYQVDTPWKEELEKRSNFHTHLIALGGISPKNIVQLNSLGFDGFALMGCIWNSINGQQNFKLCKQIAL